jgi:hypothetical protein
VWVFTVFIVCGFVWRINADQSARTERISGDFTCRIDLTGILSCSLLLSLCLSCLCCFYASTLS